MQPREDLLALALEEYFDVQDALKELESRRQKLRNLILAEMRGGAASRIDHPRGTVRIDRYDSFDVKSPSRVVALLTQMAWIDDVVQIKGRVLHKRASQHEDAMEALRAMAKERSHEVLVISPRRATPAEDADGSVFER